MNPAITKTAMRAPGQGRPEFLDPKGRPVEFAVTALRDCVCAEPLCDTPGKVASYWRAHIATQPSFDSEVETLAVLVLNGRRGIKGHAVVAKGTVDQVLVHAREVFRASIISSAAGIILAHNHPSGDPAPSPEDCRITRKLVSAGQLLGIQVVDHVIIGRRKHSSLLALGLLHDSGNGGLEIRLEPPARPKKEALNAPERDRSSSPAATISPGPQLFRMLAREQAVLQYRFLLRVGLTARTALDRAAADFSFKASASSLRRWDLAYERRGFLALGERKIGRVGRKRAKRKGERR